MKTVNTRYQDDATLKAFIAKQAIAEHQNILLQIFTGRCEVDFITRLVATIKEHIPHINIIGTTTSGEIIDGEVTENSTVLSFSMFEKTAIAVHCTDNTGESYQTARNLVAQFDPNRKPKVAISFADGLYINGETYLNAFTDYDKNLVVAGGLAGDNGGFEQTIVFTHERVMTNGAVVALLYNNDLHVNTAANLGWVNIGKTLTITKAKENIVYEIDGMKAVDLYAKYLGDETVSDLPRSALEFPLLIKREGLNIARAMIAKGDDGSLVFAGNVGVGDKVTFGYGNIETIMQGKHDICENVGAAASESIFIYSCMARKTLVGSNIEFEVHSLAKIAPSSGFFTYGEFFSNRCETKNEVLNQTMTVLSLSESEHAITPQTPADDERSKVKDNQTLKALARLISETSYELEKINSTLEMRVEEEIEKNRNKEKQLLQQSRLAQMGEMMSMIAHQWRQPLNAISLTVSALHGKVKQKAYEQRFFESRLERISDYVLHLSSTIEDFRNFFKPDKEKEATKFSDIAKNVLRFVQTGLESENIVVKTEFVSTERMFSYANELLQVTMNLMKNAEDALMERRVAEPTITIRCYSEKESEVLEIEDNAGGIDEAILDKIFDPYFTTKEEHNGTGLGLYMSKLIVEEHCQGTLRAYNTDNGALFRIKLDRLGEELP